MKRQTLLEGSSQAAGKSHENMSTATVGTCTLGVMKSLQCLNVLKRVNRPSGRGDKGYHRCGAPPDWPGNHPSPPEWSKLELI